jgi:very-short-patch-repair endonuclease
VTALSPAEVKRLKAKAKREVLEDKLAIQLDCVGLRPVRQFRFHPVRRWRSDFAFPEHCILVEVDGGEWVKSAHNTGYGRRRDNEKDRAAQALGYTVLRFTGSEVRDGTAARVIEEAVSDEPA